jgi:OmpA-OmpF porin, OOP family
MSKFGKFLIGVLITLLIGTIAHFYHRNQIAADLTQSAQAELDANYMSWAKISFIGDGLRYRNGLITGAPPTPESAEEARMMVIRKLHNNSFSFNNMLRGGVHNVFVRASDVAGPAEPYIWRGEIVGSEVVLRGSVPDQDTKQALIGHAKSLFDGKGFSVVDQMEVRANPPAGDWAGAAKRGLTAIAGLGNEFTELNDTTLTVVGVAKTKTDKDKAEGDINALAGSGYTPAPAITMAAEIVTAEPEAPAAAQAEVDTCQQDIDKVMADKTVNFDTGKASLKRSPDALLDQLAAVAAKCPDTSIAIAGHTDKRGNDDANMKLSEARAETVRNYLAGKGIAAARLTAKGFGETQPLDAADTPEAYEKNRRIEFTVAAAN